MFDSGRFPAWEHLGDAYRYIFEEGIRVVMHQRVREGFLARLQAAQIVLDDQKYAEWRARYLDNLSEQLQALLKRGHLGMAREYLVAHTEAIQRALEGEHILRDEHELTRALELHDELKERWGRLLVEAEDKGGTHEQLVTQARETNGESD